ncbi:MAG TPA: sulfatase-like hydrolase/transferase [Gemmataceae bacterium]|nr:sulfatase-like hydrolase/transferase [Gemmataceae bacterium]
MKAIAFVLRGCPAGWLGPYGNEWVVTPNLDRLAAEGVVFDQHFARRPGERIDWRTPTVREGVTPGLTPSLTVGVRPHIIVRANHADTDAPPNYYAAWGEVFDARPQPDDDSPLENLLRTLPALLDRLTTSPDWFVCVETDYLLPPWDVSHEVFAAYLADPEEEEAHVSDVEYEGDEPAAEVAPEEAATPWFDPPTGPLDAADPDAREWLHTTFAAVVTKLDAELGELFEVLRERGLDRSAAWAVTSDFGYPLGEHGSVGLHQPHLHEELVHLPLIVRLPGGAEAGRRIPAITQPADTLTAIEALTRGEAVAGREFAVSVMGAEAAIRTPEWALLLRAEGEPLLFEKPDDRWEVNDLRARHVELAEELEQKLKEAITPQMNTEDHRPDQTHA